MSTTSTEAPFVVSANFCAIRGNTMSELLDNLRNFNANSDEIAEEIATFKAIVGQRDATAQAVGAVKAAMPGSEVIERVEVGPEEITDKYGNQYTYNHPDAPEIAPGVQAVLKSWTSKSGKHLTAFVHPVKGPKPCSKDTAGDHDFIEWK